MTVEEKKLFESLNITINGLIAKNIQLHEDVSKQIEAINTKVETKQVPVHLESRIVDAVQQTIGDVISKALLEYGSPMKKLVESVIGEYSADLRQIISDSFNRVIKTDEFKASIVAAFSHKVARTIISNNDGLFDTVSKDLKRDAIFKAKMSLAVSNVVEECLRERS